MVEPVTWNGFHDGVTLGSFVIGLALVVLNVGSWWPGRKGFRSDPLYQVMGVLPFLFGYCYGIALMLCGGLLGWFGDVVLWGGSWLGDGALIWGVGGHRQSVQSTTLTALSDGGLAMVLIFGAVAVVVSRRHASARTGIRHGVLAGILTGTVRGYLGVLAVPVATGLNLSGAWLPGAS
jgi:hypothetical protein